MKFICANRNKFIHKPSAVKLFKPDFKHFQRVLPRSMDLFF